MKILLVCILSLMLINITYAHDGRHEDRYDRRSMIPFVIVPNPNVIIIRPQGVSPSCPQGQQMYQSSTGQLFCH